VEAAVIIRLSERSDREEILRFVAEMGFNPRDAATWDGLGMVAMTAWEGPRLVGSIPMEPRALQVGGGRCVATVHETVVAVHPEWRNKRVGSRLQEAIFETRPGGAEMVTVFREEPESAAYRWYVRNGFAAVARVDSWFAEELGTSKLGPEFEVRGSAETGACWTEIERLRLEVDGDSVGLIGRGERPLHRWLDCHPYRGRYAFHFVMERARGELGAYALLGVGRMHSETTRADVLEFCVRERGREVSLIRAVLTVAKTYGWRPVRWPLASTDPNTATASAEGFTPAWGFDMLVKPMEGTRLAPCLAKDWRYAGIDYA
jgi:GNAT superfamily N-acetyltransferase